MDRLFINVFNMSISASYLILAVIAVRFLLRKAPKGMRSFLWLLVGVKLIFPFSIESVFSLVPSSHVVDESIYYENQPTINSGISTLDTTVNQYLKNNYAPIPEHSVNKMQLLGYSATAIWFLGMIIMLGYMMVSWICLKSKVKEAVPMSFSIDENRYVKIYQSDAIESPFLLGIIKPRIYIPFYITQENLPYVIMHENIHIRRKDYLIKPIGFLILAVYWFNPCVWLAYILLCKDIELICDEQVVKKLGLECKKAYSQALLTCSVKRRMIAACPVAFGEIGVKERIKNVLSYKKPAFWVLIAAVLACIIIPICFMTRKKADTFSENTTVVSDTVIKEVVEKEVEEQKEIADAEESLILDEKINVHLGTWARAFCNRDGQTIRDMVSDRLAAELIEGGMLSEAGEGFTFGWSSPWPWGVDDNYSNENMYNYRIVDTTEHTAQILYYAWTSDPHVTVWCEELVFTLENDTFVINSEKLKVMEGICVAEEFYKAYPNGTIKGTMMDYYSYNGAGEALNNNALENKDSQYYSKLFSPDTAARYLLNILNNSNKVHVLAYGNADTCKVEFTFYEDNSKAYVEMIRPYGEEGIWVPYSVGEYILNEVSIQENEVSSNDGIINLPYDDNTNDTAINLPFDDNSDDTELVTMQYSKLLRNISETEGYYDILINYEAPVKYTRISDDFGERINPVTQEKIYHTGVDFIAEKGTDITAAADGTVYETGYDADAGNYVIIQHSNGEFTYYFGCDEIFVKSGEKVNTKNRIATLGQTGKSTGAHLHFAVSREGAYIKPEYK